MRQHNDFAHSHITWTPELIERYDMSGPRYTSYPSVLSFDDWDTAKVLAVIERSDLQAPLSLYVHIPFCRHLCYYCACNKVVTRDHSRADAYLDALAQEMRQLAPWFAQRPVHQLHWGGGTPTFLTDTQTDRLYGLLAEHFDLQSAPEEYSIEIDPRVTSAERLQQLYDLGFHRISMGIQDFNAETQAAVHRIQPFDEVAELVAAARRIGYRSINFDLIYGLPLQTVERFHDTLAQVMTLRPERIACYHYAHLPSRFSPQRRLITSDLPTPATKLAIFADVIQTLQQAGYVYLGMDHFALPEDDLTQAWHNQTLQRNFQGYATQGGTDVLALGVSAISRIGNSYWQNHKDLDTYQSAVHDALPVMKGYHLKRDDVIRGHIIQRLTCHNEITWGELADAFGINVRLYLAREWPLLEQLEQDGLIELSAEGMRITNSGRLLLRPICMVFDAHLESTVRNRFSRVI